MPDLNDENEQKDKLKNQIETLTSEVRHWKDQELAKYTKLNEVTNSNNELQIKLNTANAKILELEKEAEESIASIRDLNTTAETHTKEASNAATQISALKAQLANVQRELSWSNTTLQRRVEDVEEKQRLLSVAERTSERQASKIIYLQSNIAALQGVIQAQFNVLSAASADAAVINESKNRIESALSQLQTRVTALLLFLKGCPLPWTEFQEIVKTSTSLTSLMRSFKNSSNS